MAPYKWYGSKETQHRISFHRWETSWVRSYIFASFVSLPHALCTQGWQFCTRLGRSQTSNVWGRTPSWLGILLYHKIEAVSYFSLSGTWEWAEISLKLGHSVLNNYYFQWSILIKFVFPVPRLPVESQEPRLERYKFDMASLMGFQFKMNR